MDGALALGLAVNGAYDAAVAVALFFIARDVWSFWRTAAPPRRALVYPALAVVATAITWGYIAAFARADQAAYESYVDWMRRSVFFFTAWEAVSGTPDRWWWSSQLVFAVPVIAAFLAIEGRRRHVPAVAAYIWLGFLGAISTALALFLFRTHRPAPAGEDAGPSTTPAALVACMLLAVAGALLLPYLDGTAYRADLLIAQGIMLVPFHLRSRDIPVSTATLYGLTGVIALAAHAANTARLLSRPGWPGSLLDAIQVNGAQTSVCWDLAFVWILTAAIMLRQRRASGAVIAAVGLVISPGAALGFYLAWRESASARGASTVAVTEPG